MATMEDVARKAGVAVSTVSYALSGTRPISAATRDKIDVAMAALDYKPHAVARALASKKSGIIAVVLPSSHRSFGPTESNFVSGAVEAAREKGHHVVVWSSELRDRTDLDILTGAGLVDGVVLMEVSLNDIRVAELRRLERPLALIGRTADTDGLDYVDIDFEQTAQDAVEHLHALGHSSIALVNHSQADFDAGYGPAVRMKNAYEVTIADRGLQPLHMFCEDSRQAGYVVGDRIVDQHPDTTAAIAMNERAVPGLLQALANHGLNVPHDFSMLSAVSSAGVAQMTVPQLTVLEAPSHSLGRRSIEMLLQRVTDPDSSVVQEVLPCRLIAGDSTAPPRRRKHGALAR